MTAFRKMIATGVAALTMAAAPGFAHAASSFEGIWNRGDGKARVRIKPCGGGLCAVNIWIRQGTPHEKVGDILEMKVSETQPSHWTGTAYDPQRKLNMKLTVKVTDSSMVTRGCLLMGLACKSMTWTRADDA